MAPSFFLNELHSRPSTACPRLLSRHSSPASDMRNNSLQGLGTCYSHMAKCKALGIVPRILTQSVSIHPCHPGSWLTPRATPRFPASSVPTARILSISSATSSEEPSLLRKCSFCTQKPVAVAPLMAQGRLYLVTTALVFLSHCTPTPQDISPRLFSL